MRWVVASLFAAAVLPAAGAAEERPAKAIPIYGYSSPPLQTEQQGLRGTRISRHAGAETERSGNDPTYLRGLEREFQLQQRATVYGVAYMPLTPKADVFARVGYGGGSRAAPLGFGAADSWKYGAGAQYFPNARNGLRADYTRHDFRNARVKANVLSMGYVRRF